MSDGLLSDADVGIGGSAPPAAPALLSDDDVGLGASAPQSPTLQSTASAPLFGFESGMADVVGAPVDAATWYLNKVGNQAADLKAALNGQPTPPESTAIQNAPLSSDWIKQNVFGATGANPDAPENMPRSTTEAILRAGGSGAGQMIAPEATLGGLTRAGLKIAPRVADFATAAFGKADTPAAVAKNAVIGAASGATGQAAAEVVPKTPAWQMGAQLAGGLFGGVLGATATDVHPFSTIKSFVAPLTKEGREVAAGQELRNAATSPSAAIDTIENEPSQIVPGSNPTTFQQTGDMGLGALERRVQTQNPAAFNEARAGQNQARVAALGNIQATGSPEDVSAALRANLDALSAKTDADVGAATTTAQGAVSGLGGEQSPAFYGEQIRGQIQPQLDAATQNAAGATNALGGTGTPEGYGAALREPMQAAKDAAQQARSKLYAAVDPTNSLNVVAAPLREAGDAVASNLSPMAAQPTGEEAAILGTIRALPDVVPFSDLQALDSRITAAMSAERRSAGETPVWGRLSQMKGAVSDAIDNGVANQVQYERGQVASGAMAPEDTLEQRYAAWGQNAVDAFYANRNASVASGGEGAVSSARSGPSASAGVSRTAGTPRGGPGSPVGSSGVPGETLTPNFDQAAADRLAQAKQAHATYAQTYRNGPVGNALKTTGFSGQYRTPNVAVPDSVFPKGPKGFEAGIAFRNAVRNDPAAIDAAHNYAAMTLRRMAERPDGTIDPAGFVKWRMAYADALRAFPELLPRFATAARASEELNRFAPFRADMAPFQVPEVFFHAGPGGREGVDNLRRLIGDTRAQSILQDYAASKLRTTALRQDGTLDPAKVAAFQKSHAPALQSFPELNAKFSSAAKASETVNQVAAEHKQTLDGYQAGVIGKIMNAAPEDVAKHVGAIFGSKDAVAQMGRLATEASRGGPDAVSGLRKAIADYITSKFVSNTEAGTSEINLVKSDAFQTFMRQSRPALAKVFSPAELDAMNAIARDLHRANRTVTAVKIPGASNTAQDTTAVRGAEHAPEGSLLNALLVGGGVGYEAHGIHGAVVGAGVGLAKHIIGVARSAGYTKVDELVRDAMLDPDLARRLMMKAAPVSKGSELSLTQKLMRVGTMTAANQIPNRAAGGRIAA